MPVATKPSRYSRTPATATSRRHREHHHRIRKTRFLVKAEQFPARLQPLLRTFHIDFDGPPPPSPLRLLVASLVALGGSLLADWLLVKLGVHVFPSTRGFAHFQFGDYAKLTIIGVVIACAGWPLVHGRYLATSATLLPGRHRDHDRSLRAGRLHLAQRCVGHGRLRAHLDAHRHRDHHLQLLGSSGARGSKYAASHATLADLGGRRFGVTDSSHAGTLSGHVVGNID